jgi:hypothetical protein
VFYFIFLFLISFTFIGQENWESEINLIQFDSTFHNKIYEVKINDYQILQLIKNNNDTFNGFLIHSIWKTNRKEEKIKKIVLKKVISILKTKELFLTLNKSGFENIEDCKSHNDCMIGFDGTTTTFNYITTANKKSVNFWELESDSSYKKNSLKEYIIKARNILSEINKVINLTLEFDDFLSKVPNGKYSYSSIIFEKKRK